MSDIGEMVTWLREQLDRAERMAQAATPGPWHAQDGGVVNDDDDQWPVSRTESERDRADRVHIARHDPAHELNIVAAHRRLLDLAGRMTADAVEFAAEGDAEWMRLTSTAQYIRRTLAAGYAGRDGYRAEWGQR